MTIVVRRSAGVNSSAAATDANADTALGYGDNAELGLTTFSGVALTGPEILVKYTYYGDADLSGVVDPSRSTAATPGSRCRGLTEYPKVREKIFSMWVRSS